MSKKIYQILFSYILIDWWNRLKQQPLRRRVAIFAYLEVAAMFYVQAIWYFVAEVVADSWIRTEAANKKTWDRTQNISSNGSSSSITSDIDRWYILKVVVWPPANKKTSGRVLMKYIHGKLANSGLLIEWGDFNERRPDASETLRVQWFVMFVVIWHNVMVL